MDIHKTTDVDRRVGNTNRIRIIIADDHAIVRDSIRSLIQQEQDIEIIAEAANGQEAVDYALKYKPDAIIMDVSMPVMNGVEATRQIIAKLPGVKVIALSFSDSNSSISDMLNAGASAYVIKDKAPEELIKTIINLTYISQ